jgi:hypothetical protein
MGKKGRSQAKTISKSLGSTNDQGDIQHYFNQMVGSEKADPAIVLPKYKDLISSMKTISRLLKSFSTDILCKLGEQKIFVPDIEAYTSNIDVLIGTQVPDETFEPENYTAIKDHDLIQTFIVLCSNISDIRAHLKYTWADVDKKFMNRYTNHEFTPFPFAKVDFKRIWLVDAETNPSLREYVFELLSSLLKCTHRVYKIVTSPDVDVSKLSKIIVSALGSLRKHLPRCGKAFRKIEESVGMLEGNFDGYYMDFIQSKDPTNIFTSFIGDVADNCDSDPQLIFQCRKIVNFYRRSAQKKVANGEVSSEKTKMFETLMKNYNLLEKKASHATGIEPESEHSDDSKEEKNSDNDNGEGDDYELQNIDELMAQINDPNKLSISKEN